MGLLHEPLLLGGPANLGAMTIGQNRIFLN